MKLSICIPTYNFGRFIGQTLDSIIAQRASGIEIVVLDGGSSDETPEVLTAYQARCPEIRYVRQDARGGIDRDMARSVELATGDYCWLFSSDDLMKDEALARVLSEIESGLDVYLCGLTICDAQMKVLREHAVSNAAPGSIYHLQSERERHEYFRQAVTTTAFFSFMGSLIVRRERWLSGTLEPEFIGSCWAHVVRLFRLLPGGLTVKYLGDSLLLKRGDNDSFMDRGIAHRYAIAIEGYQRIAQRVFGEQSFEARQIRRVVANEFQPNAFFAAKLQSLRAGRPEDVQRLEQLASVTYRDATPRNLILRALNALMWVRAYESARYLYRRLRGLPVS